MSPVHELPSGEFIFACSAPLRGGDELVRCLCAAADLPRLRDRVRSPEWAPLYGRLRAGALVPEGLADEGRFVAARTMERISP